MLKFSVLLKIIFSCKFIENRQSRYVRLKIFSLFNCLFQRYQLCGVFFTFTLILLCALPERFGVYNLLPGWKGGDPTKPFSWSYNCTLSFTNPWEMLCPCFSHIYNSNTQKIRWRNAIKKGWGKLCNLGLGKSKCHRKDVVAAGGFGAYVQLLPNRITPFT